MCYDKSKNIQKLEVVSIIFLELMINQMMLAVIWRNAEVIFNNIQYFSNECL
jgi:hypothetical protein